MSALALDGVSAPPTSSGTARARVAAPARKGASDHAVGGRPTRWWSAILLVLVLAPEARVAPQADKPATDSKPRLLSWSDDLQAARDRGRRDRRPILVRFEATWCVWCRKLDEELAKPAVQKELPRWTLVALDADRSPREAALLGVDALPSLRVLGTDGTPVATRDGFLDADALVEWLRASHDAASIEAPAGLAESEPPSALVVVRLVRAFASRDPAVREAAIRRVLPFPSIAAPSVVRALTKRELQSRLAALELLREWKAPIDAVDPWQPETVSAARLNDLRQWATDIEASVVPSDQPLGAEELASAQRDLDRYLHADAEEGRAVRERLARFGRRLLPVVIARLGAATTDRSLERLTALRYRLVASPALALDWSDGFARLAATDVEVRHQAARELTERAGGGDEGLLLELFANPDSLVRELALRRLNALGGAGAAGALVGLLNDPEPNVRAAVLKQLAESPTPGMVAKVAKYVAEESDADLVVHAVRFLREAKGPAAFKTLIGLLEHDSWRVRAEAAEAVGKTINPSGYASSMAFSNGNEQVADGPTRRARRPCASRWRR